MLTSQRHKRVDTHLPVDDDVGLLVGDIDGDDVFLVGE
jgi:hypothetical protein